MTFIRLLCRLGASAMENKINMVRGHILFRQEAQILTINTRVYTWAFLEFYKGNTIRSTYGMRFHLLRGLVMIGCILDED